MYATLRDWEVLLSIGKEFGWGMYTLLYNHHLWDSKTPDNHHPKSLWLLPLLEEKIYRNGAMPRRDPLPGSVRRHIAARYHHHLEHIRIRRRGNGDYLWRLSARPGSGVEQALETAVKIFPDSVKWTYQRGKPLDIPNSVLKPFSNEPVNFLVWSSAPSQVESDAKKTVVIIQKLIAQFDRLLAQGVSSSEVIDCFSSSVGRTSYLPRV